MSTCAKKVEPNFRRRGGGLHQKAGPSLSPARTMYGYYGYGCMGGAFGMGMRPSFQETMFHLEMLKQQREEEELKEQQTQLIDPSPYETEGLRARERARLKLPLWQPLAEEKKKQKDKLAHRRKMAPRIALVAVAVVATLSLLVCWEFWGGLLLIDVGMPPVTESLR